MVHSTEKLNPVTKIGETVYLRNNIIEEEPGFKANEVSFPVSYLPPGTTEQDILDQFDLYWEFGLAKEKEEKSVSII